MSERPLGIDEDGERARHLILIVIDTLRADVLGCYGGDAKTPEIDALARQGVRFDRAYSQIPITGPAHSTLFTSLLPSEHGVRNNAQILAYEHLTMAELLSDRGWRTAAFISLGVLQNKFGFAQGFTEYHQWFDGGWWHDAGEVNNKLLPWLDTLGDESLFLFAHYSDPHEPYAPPGVTVPQLTVRVAGEVCGTVDARGGEAIIPLEVPSGDAEISFEAAEMPLKRDVVFRQLRVRNTSLRLQPVAGLTEIKEARASEPVYRSGLPAYFELTNPNPAPVKTELVLQLVEKLSFADMRALYLQETAYVDREIGRLLDALKATGLWRDSLIIFTSDHGEGLGDHHLGGHLDQLYDSLLQIPLILVSHERLPEDTVVESFVSLVDFLPTVGDLLGVEMPVGVRGRSMVPLIDNPVHGGVIIAETYRPQAKDDRLAVIDRGLKYIVSSQARTEELFDLIADPQELTDLADRQPEDLVVLRRLLEAQLAARVRVEAADGAKLSERELSQLEALGYVSR